jgi:hypothetical protein
VNPLPYRKYLLTEDYRRQLDTSENFWAWLAEQVDADALAEFRAQPENIVRQLFTKPWNGYLVDEAELQVQLATAREMSEQVQHMQVLRERYRELGGKFEAEDAVIDYLSFLGGDRS